VDVRISSVLLEHDFRFDDVAALDTTPAKGPWEAELTVQIDAAGDVEYVFLERATGDPDINAGIVMASRKAEATAPGESVTGRVLISYCPH